MFDSHVHSTFSTDSTTDPVEACEEALKKNLCGIAFTDHLDFDFPNHDDFMLDFDVYDKYMDNLKQKYKGKLIIAKGVEAGVQPHTIHQTLEVVQKYKFDFVLASAHIIDGLDPYTKEYFEGRNKYEAYAAYLKASCFVVENFPDFDTIGHFDYVARTSPYTDKNLKYNEFYDILDHLLHLLAVKGKGLEINTKPYINNLHQIEFDIKILKRFKEISGEIICLNSNSHSPRTIGGKFDAFADMLKECGFSYITYFIGRKPQYIKI